jgi:hypothetical protein
MKLHDNNVQGYAACCPLLRSVCIDLQCLRKLVSCAAANESAHRWAATIHGSCARHAGTYLEHAFSTTKPEFSARLH